MTVRALIADDHPVVADSLKLILGQTEDLEVVATVTSGEEVVQHVEDHSVDLVLLDLDFGEDPTGLEVLRRVKRASPATKVLVITMHTDAGTIGEAVRAGADGYMSKEASVEAVVGAVREVAGGNNVLDPNITDRIFGQIGRDPHRLTDDELRILQHIADGLSNRDIAQVMYVSEETIKSHLRQVFKKLGVSGRTDAVMEGLRKNLIH